MGLLDEAIRDHLELKRRHGADPGEVEALEHEALAPVRREDTATAAVEPEPEPEAQPEPAPLAEAPPPLEPELSPVEQPTESFSLDELKAAEARQEPASPAPGDDAPAEGDDVLDQTPEFLQETPEHDRLWFEQKPPRDFDF